nr:tRNA threonylcarbamoyladenosine dehydratase [Kiritimatiellia bacterium]
MNRFSRTRQLLGREGLERLRHARVMVAGLGAVGSYALEGLARAGVGFLRIVDFDTIHPSNINRQILALDDTIGRPKVDVAAERIRQINPACVVDARAEFIRRSTVEALLEPPCDVIIDAIDSLGPKVALLSAAARHGLYIVSSMGAASRTDPLSVRIGDLSATSQCPLARLVRKRLRKLNVHSGIQCVYSIEPPDAASGSEDIDESEALPDAEEMGRARTPIGSLSTI